MIKTSPSAGSSANPEQLLLGLLASLKLLLVAFAFVVLFTTLFCKALVGFATVVLMALNMAAEWIVSLVASVPEVQDFCGFLVASAR